MVVMSKSEQWKRGAIILSWVDQAYPDKSQSNRDAMAYVALKAACDEAPWDYPWYEVIASIRERSASALAKGGK